MAEDSDGAGDQEEQPMLYSIVEIISSGKRGQTVDYFPEENRYLVQTFEGETEQVDESDLKLFVVPLATEGGFDVLFPESTVRSSFFTTEILDALDARKYCVVQCSSKPEDRRSASSTAEQVAKWIRLVPDFESDFTGRDAGRRKLQWVEDEVLDESEDAGMCAGVQLLQEMGAAVMTLSPALGFNGVEQSNILMTMKCTEEEQTTLLSALEDDKAKVVDAREIRDLLCFASRRKVCILYFVNGDGGSLTLHPEDADLDEVTLQCKEGQMVVFLHDEMDYTYIPDEGSLALQTWVLRERLAGEEGGLLDQFEDSEMETIDTIPLGPKYGKEGESVDIMSFAPKIPGQVWDGLQMWTMVAVACDCIYQVPIMRWDHDIYWTDEQEPGKGYVKHYGFISQDQMALFDPEFFGFEGWEAFYIDPPARGILEMGYEALSRGGWTKKLLPGTEIAMFMGYAESEFIVMAMRGEYGISPEIRHQTFASTAGCRLHYCLGTIGPAATIETACSSSLTASALTHSQMRPVSMEASKSGCRKQCNYGIASGGNGHFDPFYSIALCGASMLTHLGRCFTFDNSADGFARGEGQCSMYLKVSTREDFSRLAMLCGSCMNQDGRSASLTAPHGPSQQECIRYSLREANIDAFDIQIQELHGTGTALGDPIEVGALRATMMSSKGVVRDMPLVKTSAKANTGHTEMCAGIIGLSKCVLLGVMATSAPNIHLRSLNPHIDYNGYPVLFTPEYVDQGKAIGYNGVSSFGFGGSNARGDVWARCLAGPRNTNPVHWGLDYSFMRIMNFARIFGYKETKTGGGGTELGAEDLYDYGGDFMIGDPRKPDNSVFIQGSFNGWGVSEKMDYNTETGVYSVPVAIGECLMEQFTINVNEYEDARIFPVHKNGTMMDKVLGPGAAPEGHYWVIDARSERSQPGAVYMVSFWFDENERQKKVFWEETSDPEAKAKAFGKSFKHQYSIVGSFAGFRPCLMQQAGRDTPNVWESSFQIGLNGTEEFNILRDGRPEEAIYPAFHRSTSTATPLRGPDNYGIKKYLGVVGESGDVVKVSLKIANGKIGITLDQDNLGKMTYKTMNGPAGERYSVVGTFSEKPIRMQSVGVGRFCGTFCMERRYLNERTHGPVPETFVIIKDDDPCQAIHPEMEYAEVGLSKACGPDHQGKGTGWVLGDVESGEPISVILDLTVKDKKKMVSWQEGDALSERKALGDCD